MADLPTEKTKFTGGRHTEETVLEKVRGVASLTKAISSLKKALVLY